MTLQFPTLFEALPPADAVKAVTPRPLFRRGFLVAALLVAVAALAGCESPDPHTLLDPEADLLEATLAPAADSATAPTVHETVNPGSGAVRMPFALQGYGG